MQGSQTKTQDTKNLLNLLNEEINQANLQIQETERFVKKFFENTEKAMKDEQNARKKCYDLSSQSAHMMMETRHANEMAQNNAIESQKLIESKQLIVYRTMADVLNAIRADQPRQETPNES